jgi:glycosyltransferase involved in cell wall biosynthesis
VPLSSYDRFVARLEARSLPRAPVVTTESTFAVQYLKNRYPFLKVQQAEHAPNRAFLAVQRRPDTKPPHFISVGTINYRKGTDLLFRALDELAAKIPFKFTLVSSSEPDYLRHVKSKASAALLQRTNFKHFILPHEVAAELQTPTLLLLPTRADTSPNAVKEAVVAGVPVVASEIGGIPDYVFPGKNGMLFPAGSLPKFVQAIQSACAHPLFSQGQVEPETLSRTRNYLSPELMAENFLKAYKMAMAE